ncbi:SIMPL domain-containing protein [Cupriavidus sp. 2TAF22]|uniref:SIMPL domain-containing protein n=1 Tax=unclassified Cupriavidus TaxID=2640874 RepID=UPI003F929C77
MKQLLAATLLGTAAMVASAQGGVPTHDPAPAGVLALAAQAATDVPTDVVHLTLAAEQEGAEPGAISSALSAKAKQVIEQARRTSGVQAESGGFSINPSTDRNGRISTWRGRAEVILQSRDFTAVSKLAGQLSSQMQVQSIAFSLSREARQAAEAKLTEQAVASFRGKADATTKLFGYSSYSIREVQVGDVGAVQPVPRMYAAKAMMADSAPVPVEGGKAQVTVTVNGSVQMLK